jgi:hypothetical protein
MSEQSTFRKTLVKEDSIEQPELCRPSAYAMYHHVVTTFPI